MNGPDAGEVNAGTAEMNPEAANGRDRLGTVTELHDAEKPAPAAASPSAGSPAARPLTAFWRYTVWSVLAVVVGLPLVALLSSPVVPLAQLDQFPVLLGMLVAQVLATCVFVHLWFRRWLQGDHVSRAVTVSCMLPGVVAALLVLVRLLHGSLTDVQILLGLVTLMAAAMVPSTQMPWQASLIPAAAVPLLAMALGLTWREALPMASFVLAAALAVRSSLWLLELVREVGEARAVEGCLALAEERLRFSRDVHDVMGRDLSTIAVTAELVTRLAERGDPRAAVHARTIADTARGSLAEMRALVRGYRSADLAAELQGTLSLLRSAGIGTHLDGSVEDVPASHAEAAAWTLREAGTNLLRHAHPRRVEITLHPGGLRVTNDGAPPREGAAETPVDLPAGAGLTGLRERIGPARRLHAWQHQDRVTVDLIVDSDTAPPRMSAPQEEP